MRALSERIEPFATRETSVATRDDDDLRPLAVLNPDALTPYEAERLRREGFDVPPVTPKPSIWK